MKDILFHQSYAFAGDICALMLCAISWFLLMSTYSIRQKNLLIFYFGNLTVFIAAASSILFQSLIGTIATENIWIVYLFKEIKTITLILTYVLFCIYIMNLVDLRTKHKKPFLYLVWGAFAAFVLYEVVFLIMRPGFPVDKQLQVHKSYFTDVFWFAYLYYSVLIVLLFSSHKRQFITQVYRCIKNVMIFSFSLIILEWIFASSTFTCVTFAFPILVALFLFHHNSYDIQTGTLDSRSFDNYIERLRDRKFGMIYLYLHDVNMDKMQSFSEEFFRFNECFFKDTYAFRLRDDKLAMVYEVDKNLNARESMVKLLEDFSSFYERYKLDYYIVLMDADERIKSGREYKELDEYVESKMQINSIHQCTKEDVDEYLELQYIMEQLKDIQTKQDLEDERVLVYCQPVYNTQTDTFSSAEALMRMELPEIGMIYPDQFISIAEKKDYIHTLSLIILNKTCKAIKTLEQQGYLIERISVKFAIAELRDPNFKKDILDIIKSNGIPSEKIAVELSECKNEADFKVVKRVMTELQSQGLKFYLNDFGIGYSNFERLAELSIDIIKFDRSLTILAGKDEDARHMVENFSEILKRSNCQILFEGVEDGMDEEMCKGMNAQYLQGFKYSRPIPIEQLTLFLEKGTHLKAQNSYK